MINKLPLVSIIITNFNREKTIATAIESALSQDYPNLEIIISDNCSTDNSLEIISNYISDSRIIFFRNDCNIGMVNNFAVSIYERAKGEYFSIVNSDDSYINNSFISQSVELINKYENVVLVKAGSYHKFNSEGKYYSYNNQNEFQNGINFLESYYFQNFDFSWCGILIYRKLFCELDLMRKSKVVAADYFINFNLSAYGNICFLNKLSYQFNIHDTNESKTSIYDYNQFNIIFNEIKDLNQLLVKKLVNKATINNINFNFRYAYFANFYEFYYRFRRSELKNLVAHFESKHDDIIKTYFKSKRKKLHDIVFWNNKLGEKLVNLKWKFTRILTC